MGMAGLLEVIPGGVFLVVSLALAGLLLYLGPRRRANRVFALILLLDGVEEGAGLAGRLVTDPATSATWGSVGVYAALPLALVWAYFIAVYPRPRRWLPSGWKGPAPFALGALALLVVYTLDPSLWIDPSRSSDIWFGHAPGPLYYLTEGLDRIVLPAAVFVLARDYLSEPDGAHGTSPLLISLGIAVSPLFYAPRSLASQAVHGLPPHPLTTLVPLTQVLLIGGAAAWVTVPGLRSARADVRRVTRRYGTACGAMVLAGIAYGALLSVGSGFWALLFLLNLVMPVLVAYALVRHQIFGLDLRAKWAIRQSTLVGAFAVVYLLASQGAQRYLADRASVAVGLAATGGLALAFLPLMRRAERFADALFPGVERSSAYLDARRLDHYRVALEENLERDGSLRRGAQPRLARLRRELGLTHRDHALLSHTVRAARRGEIGSTDLAPGAPLLGRYRIVRRLGESPLARTVLVEEQATGRSLVVKGLIPLGPSRDAILHEAEALRSVDHENVVQLEEVTEAAGLVFLVMEYVEGGPLSDRITEGGVDPSAVRDIGLDLLAALETVHARGMVHRDVKPSNVLLTPEGRAKLADFGIAQTPREQTTVSFLGGGAAGTVRYMSPEQAREHEVDARSDLYAAAVTLYEAYTGEPYMRARPAESAFEMQLRVARNRGFDKDLEPSALRSWFERALAPDPADRFQTAAEMRGAFQEALSLLGPAER